MSEPPAERTGAGRAGHPGTAQASDRRTMIVAATIAVVLIAAGVVSAAMFARSACHGLGPEPTAERVSSDLAAAITSAFGTADPTAVDELVDAVTELSGALGPLTGVADVSGADRLAPVAEGVAAVGGVTTVLGDGGGAVRATAQVGHAATVAGDGSALFLLALTNPLTGQVDAVQPVDTALEPAACTDTAVVGSPLAFEVAAADGRLALLRIEDDASDPAIELRDAERGRLWAAGFHAAPAPPGVLGEWLTGAVGEELVVVGQRTAPASEQPVLVAFEGRDGTPRWQLGREDLAGALPSDAPARVDVVAFAGEVVIVQVRPEEDGPPPAEEVPVLVAVSVDDGTIAWQQAQVPGSEVRDVVAHDGRVWIAASRNGRVVVERVDTAAAFPLAEVAGSTGRLGRLPDGRLVVTAGSGVVVIDAAGTTRLGAPLAGRDVVVVEGRVTLLLEGPGGGAIAATFGA